MSDLKSIIKIALLMFLSLLCLRCTNHKDLMGSKPTITQGFWGRVEFWEGDFMPRPPTEKSTGTITCVCRKILIYELTHYNQVHSVPENSAFFDRIFTSRVAITWSNAEGYYQIALPSGHYSLFVEENGLFYANRFDDGDIQPVIVLPDSITRYDIKIDYKACY
jgi:hypothetical protein